MILIALVVVAGQACLTAAMTASGVALAAVDAATDVVNGASALRCAALVGAPKSEWPALEEGCMEALAGDESATYKVELHHGGGEWFVSYAEAGLLTRICGAFGLMSPEYVSCIRVIAARAYARRKMLAVARAQLLRA